MKPLIALTILALAQSPTTAIAAQSDPLVLAPSSPWNMHYDDESCVLRRTFGEGEEKVQLDLRRYSPMAGIQATVIAESLAVRKGSMRYRIAPQWDWHDVNRPTLPVFDGNKRGVIFEIYEEGDATEEVDRRPHLKQTLAKVASGTSVELDGPFTRDINLETGGLTDPLKAMDACLGDLVHLWGLDPVEQAELQNLPMLTNRPAVTENFARFFPGKALAANVDGLINARMMIDEKGTPTSCVLQSAISDKSYQDRACQMLMKSGKFDPARNKAGQAVPGYWTTQVSFKVD